jgi:hypothetical protein
MSESNQFAVGEANDHRVYIENGSGYDVAVLDRLAIGDTPLHANVAGTGVEVEQHATTDAEWQSIIDLIAAAPEMLTVLKKSEYVCFDDRTEVLEYFRSVQAVLAKAEPPRKQRVTVTVEVEVEGLGNDEWAVDKAIDLVRTGNGIVTGTTIGGVMG